MVLTSFAGGRDVVCRRAMDLGDVGHDAEELQQTAQLGVSREPVDLFPVDRGTVGDRLG